MRIGGEYVKYVPVVVATYTGPCHQHLDRAAVVSGAGVSGYHGYDALLTYSLQAHECYIEGTGW